MYAGSIPTSASIIMKKKILVSGSSGFIGFHISKFLLEKEFSVVGVDSMNDYYDLNLKKQRLETLKKNKKFKFCHSDLIQFDRLNKIFINEEPDVVIHLAAQAGVRYSKINPKSYIDSNLIVFSNMIENVRKFKTKLIYASSSSVYGGKKKYPFKESDTINPKSFYGLTKKINEDIADFYSKEFNLNIIGLRFFTVYGPFGRPDMAYYKFCQRIKENVPIVLYNQGLMSRDMTYIDDICQGIYKAIINDFICHQIFNLGNNNPIELAKLISHIENYLDKKAIIKYEDSPDEVKKTYADITKSNELLGYSPKVSFEDGMNNFLNWYKRNFKL